MNPEPHLSFSAVARELAPPLLRYLRRCVGEWTVADDLLQETLIRIERGLPDFAGRSSLKTWTYSIATRVVSDYFRLPERRLRIVEVDDFADFADPHRSINQRIVLDEMNACVREVIDSLPEDYRAALVLHDLEELNARQVADICGCSLSNAKIRIHRGRQRLRAALQGQCTFYRDEQNALHCDRK